MIRTFKVLVGIFIICFIYSLTIIGRGIYLLWIKDWLMGSVFMLGGVVSGLIHAYNIHLVWGFIQNDNIRKKNEKNKFTCYELHRANMPQFGCTEQCDDCKQKQRCYEKN